MWVLFVFVWFVLCWFPFSGEVCFQSQLIPVVDRPCLALVRQCRKKKVHWASVLLQQLQQKEDSYRAENPSWMDQEEAPADIRKRIQLPVELYLAALPTLKQDVITEVLRRKDAAPGELPGQRSCNSQFSSPMICL